MKSAEVRQKFLDFFAEKSHQVVLSSSLVPHDDPTLLFTNAGMNQFKDVFLGLEKRPYVRAASSQKCVRAGGKHNDLENVGYTARHHTFFEMLGNFSFGDYFKKEAIHYAWELLTKVYGLSPEKLTITVYAEDDEAYAIWTKDIGVPENRVIRIGDNKGARYASDNFWMMGDTGPCGPCTEIFYDHGERIPGGPPGSPEENGDRFIEIWNNVFMQFNRDVSGTMHLLPRPSVDTGMGLERISAVLQGVHSNYEIDTFQHLIAAASKETACPDADNPSLRVLADHLRACSFLLADGVIPGNEGRGYVLRRIIRRAIRHGYKLGARAAFFYRLVPALVAEMGSAYPELIASENKIAATLRQEEDRFFETIDNGMGILESATRLLKAGAVLSGDLAFKLHDTYGFPLDLTEDICREQDLSVDVAAFNEAMTRQKEQARAAGKFKMAAPPEYVGKESVFHGYTDFQCAAEVIALYKDSVSVPHLNEGEQGMVVLDHTTFYAESGGQVGDRGQLRARQGIFNVEDTQKIQAGVFGHHGVLQTGSMTVGDKVDAAVDIPARQRTMRHHSATHLMHKALREVLGAEVQQKGSQVDSDKTRFDFLHRQPMTAAEICRVENIVNAEILQNTDTLCRQMAMADAQNVGAVMLFGEKYGDTVRVLDIGSSRELCGGTHVSRTGDIGIFKIIHETGVAAGIRRIEAVTGDKALALMQAQEKLLSDAAAAFRSPVSEVPAKIAQLQETARQQEKEIARLQAKLASGAGDDLLKKAVAIDGIQVLVATLTDATPDTLRQTMDKLKDKLQTAAIVLASVSEGKVSLVAGVTQNTTHRLKAGDLVQFVAKQIGGKGGGRADMAQAGGDKPEKLPVAMDAVAGWVKENLQAG